jgi:antitoxin HicB
MNNNPHIGSNFDDFLAAEGILAEVEATALKRVLAFQLSQEMKRVKLTRTELASRMKTSRASVNRLLDPKNVSVTLQTMERAALAIGKKLRIELA